MMARDTGGRASLVAADLRRDRTLLVLLTFVLTAFGLLMIYSASSIMAMTQEFPSHYNAAYYVERQLIFAGAGVVMAAVAAFADYHVWSQRFLKLIGVLSLVSLLLVLSPVAGQETYGATRWIGIGPIRLQPSEFSKAAIVLAAAALIEQYLEGAASEGASYWFRCFWLVLLPLMLILLQPDKGTVMVVGITILIMLVVAGLPLHLVGLGFALVVVAIGALAIFDDYSRARIMTMLDPWVDEYGSGYQLIQGFYAFGSGGLFGVGLGMSRQKYSYLPMAHNDFIFAVIGEELGLVGTLCVLLAFFCLVWLGFKIARSAPDLSGTLIASGCVSLLAVQLLVNVCGVLGMIPLSGKPVPFFSYGGSSIMSTLLLVGLVVSVSRSSEAAREASSFAVYEGGSSSRGLRVIEGGPRTTPEGIRSSRELERGLGGGRVSYNANGVRRIDLGPSASERLRTRGQESGRRS